MVYKDSPSNPSPWPWTPLINATSSRWKNYLHNNKHDVFYWVSNVGELLLTNYIKIPWVSLVQLGRHTKIKTKSEEQAVSLYWKVFAQTLQQYWRRKLHYFGRKIENWFQVYFTIKSFKIAEFTPKKNVFPLSNTNVWGWALYLSWSTYGQESGFALTNSPAAKHEDLDAK